MLSRFKAGFGKGRGKRKQRRDERVVSGDGKEGRKCGKRRKRREVKRQRRGEKGDGKERGRCPHFLFYNLTASAFQNARSP